MSKKSKLKTSTPKNEPSDFFISQIKTTIAIIEKFSKTDEFSPTMLINSLLSLVVLPFESAKKRNGEKYFQENLRN